MKKLNKGMVITSTVAAALAALTFAGCGNTASEIAPKTAPVNNINAVQAVKNEEAAKPAAAAKAEAGEAKTTETTTAAAKKKTDKKKSDKKKKASKKTAEKIAEKTEETSQKTSQPAVIVPVAQVQPAQTKKAAEAPASTQAPVIIQAPAAVIPDEVYPVWVEGDMYAGTYAEEIAGRGTMEITRNSDGTYSVEVNWSSSAFEKNSWNFSGEFDGRAVLRYTNCRKTTVAFDENGNYACDSNGLMTPYTTYTMGSGYIEFKDEGVLEWHDDMGDIIPGTTFVTCKQPYHTKADEIGTAGSNYYANEHTKADEIGTAGSNYYNFYYDWQAEGTFYEVAGSRMRLEISKSNMGEGLYNCTVICSGSAFDCETYGFLARYENDTLVYDRGARNYTSYDCNGNVVENYIIDEGHFGTITYTGAAGLRWTDSDGSSYVFMNDITCA